MTPLWDLISFHAQQCIEKYLKARLSEGKIQFAKTHDLATLLALLAPLEPTWGADAGSLQPSGAWAVAIRYPGTMATRVSSAEAVRVCRQWRTRVRTSLGL